MCDIETLLKRIDQEIAAEVGRQKENWAKNAEANRTREMRLQNFEKEAQHIIELVKPRLNAFVERVKPVVKADRVVRDTHALNLSFAATVAKVSLRFELLPDADVNQVRLECTQEILPIVVRYDKQSVLALPLGGAQDDEVVQWLDDRIVAFVRAYLAVVRQDPALREQLKGQLVKDPVAKICFPKHLATSTLERDGRKYYFVDEDTRREFEHQPASAKEEIQS